MSDELTPAQRRAIAKAADNFRRSMETLGLGVSIKAGDGPWVTITEPPTTPTPNPEEDDHDPTR